ncbi:hypothetical protein JL2886_03956 [Phaeobacter gallaeciensis]|uniref:Uncharacterized protein n=1 Tax=Phaeobacter gallaeciensis TaxID=60890 RepID=A0A1B0ZXJ4_9RHOB|nr:hypothetical protein JL2886_03956 [Phaeobacter gallaeciensis]
MHRFGGIRQKSDLFCVVFVYSRWVAPQDWAEVPSSPQG